MDARNQRSLGEPPQMYRKVENWWEQLVSNLFWQVVVGHLGGEYCNIFGQVVGVAVVSGGDVLVVYQVYGVVR